MPTAGLIAPHNLPQRRVPPGDRVLVNGAAGGVGAIAVQLAKAYGAHVTGVDHPRKLALVRSLGADQVIDYTREDYTRSGERWDLVFDVPGNHSFDANRKALDAARWVRPHRARRVRCGRPPLGGQHPADARAGRAIGRHPRAAGRLVPVTDKRQLMATLTPAPRDRQLRIVVDRTFPLPRRRRRCSTWPPGRQWDAS